MSVTKQTYNLGDKVKLVNINGESINFKLEFKVTSKNGAEFEMMVVSQTTLDAVPDAELEYKKVNKGSLSGSILVDKNSFQNYWLALKTSKPCEVEVELIKTELPINANVPTPTQINKPQPKSVKWKSILIVVVILAGAVLLYYLYKSSSKKQLKSKMPVSVAQNEPHEALEQMEVEKTNGESTTVSLLEKLKSFPLDE